MKQLVEFPTSIAPARSAVRSPSAEFEPGQGSRSPAVSIGKGFQGTIKRHNFGRGPVSHGSHNVRAPGSIGASADPARVFKGRKMPGRMGGKRITQKGLEIIRVDAERNLLMLRGSVPGPRTAPWRCAPMADRRQVAKGEHDRQAGEVRPSRGRLQRALQRDPGPRDGPGRHERAPPGHHSSLTRGEVAMTGAKAWRQKGTGRARVGALSVRHRRGGGNAFAPKPRNYTFKVNRKARRKALRAALSVHADRGSIAVLPADAFNEPATKQAADGLAKWGGDAAGPDRDHRRRGGGSEELPQPAPGLGRHRQRRRRGRDHRPPVDIASEGALEVLAARAGEVERGNGDARGATTDGSPSSDRRARRLREELRADGRGQVHVPRQRAGPQDPDLARRRRDLRRHGRQGPDLPGALQAEAPRPPPGKTRAWKKASSSWPRAIRSSCSRARRVAAGKFARKSPWLSARQSQPAPVAASRPTRTAPRSRPRSRTRS